MALLTMFINRPKKTELQRMVGQKEVAITLDAQLSEELSADADATMHPVENGADVTDHVIIKPLKLSINGIVSSTPLTFGSSLAGLGTTVGSTIGASLAGRLGNAGSTALGGVAGAVAGGLVAKTLAGLLESGDGQAGSGTERLETTISELIAARDAKTPVKIQTGLKHYQDFLLTGVKISRDNKDGQKIKVTLTLQQLLKASTKTTKVKVPKTLAGLSNSNLGRKNGEGLNTQQDKGSSILNSLIFGGR